ncbi:MAG: diguanylate cyclase [Proteobacteria bacterium]|nr:diguanylate cyclase [Pseudomonadota bacterium]
MYFADSSRLAQISVSIGIASFRSGESTEEFVARADHALYKAKQGGRNRLHRAE